MLVTAVLTLLGVGAVRAVDLTESQLSMVYDVMSAISTHSWENGTKAQAILERTYPTLSVFTSTGNPFPSPGSVSQDQIPQIVDVAQVTMQNRPPTNSSAVMGGSSLLSDAAAGDPASLGIAVMFASLSTGDAEVNNVGYSEAATAELNYLLYDVPRMSNGAISHRADQAQLWSDSVFMVPPFIAAYGVWSSNQSLVQTAYDQISAYRSILRTSSGLWKHIVGGTGTLDPGLWTTGNAWAAYGMLRVWASIYHSPYAGSMGTQMADLAAWAGEILQAAEQYVTSDGIFHNYINDTSSFTDSAGAALMAAAGLRLSTLNITSSYIPTALTLLSGVSDKVNSTGYLTQVVNPNSFGDQGTDSPEGQSFVVMAYSAYKEWDQAGRSGYNGSGNPLGGSSGAMRRMEPGTLAGVGTMVGLVACGMGMWLVI